MFISSSEPGFAFGSGIVISQRHILTSAKLITGYNSRIYFETGDIRKYFSLTGLLDGMWDMVVQICQKLFK